jgi:hypothetical protein
MQADERSLYYETLLEAESVAVAAKQGMHSGVEPPRSNVTDLTTQAARERAKRYVSALQRHTRVRAIVQVSSSFSTIAFVTVPSRRRYCQQK